MRTLRLTVVGAVLLAMLAVPTASAFAQTEEDTDATQPAAATGTLEFLTPDTEMAAEDEAVLHTHQWTSSDPRLTGMATYTGSWHLYNPAEEECDEPNDDAAAYEIVTDGGSWLCGGFRAPVPGPDGARNVHTLVFKGAGGYEGLSAYVLVDWSTSPYTYSALITPNSVPIVPVMQG